jgi:hypothetical protein
VFQSFVQPFLVCDSQLSSQLVEIIQCHFISVIEESDRSITETHLQKMRHSTEIALPGCNLCLLGTPINTLSCGHHVCSYCTIRTLRGTSSSSVCFLCGKENKQMLRVRPSTAGVRTLELFHHDKSPLQFLHKVRGLLFGHLSDYVDLVIGAESGEIFCSRLSPS